MCPHPDTLPHGTINTQRPPHTGQSKTIYTHIHTQSPCFAKVNTWLVYTSSTRNRETNSTAVSCNADGLLAAGRPSDSAAVVCWNRIQGSFSAVLNAAHGRERTGSIYLEICSNIPVIPLRGESTASTTRPRLPPLISTHQIYNNLSLESFTL